MVSKTKMFEVPVTDTIQPTGPTTQNVTTATLSGTGHSASPLDVGYSYNAVSDTGSTIAYLTIDIYSNGNPTGITHEIDAVNPNGGSGNYVFADQFPDAGYNGQSLQALVTEHFADGSTQNLSSNPVTFTDAAPTVSGPVEYTTAENTGSAPFTIALLANASDADGDPVSVVNSNGTDGLTVTAVVTHADNSMTTMAVTTGYTIDYTNGSFNFDPSSLTLQTGDSAAVTVSYSVQDPNHAETATTANFTVTANVPATHTGGFAVFTDDTHAITATTDSTDTTTYSGGYTVNLLSDTSDPDSTLKVDPNSVTFVVRDSNGNVVANAPAYTLADGHSAFLDADGTLHVNTALLNSLNVGQNDQITVNYTVTGDQGGTSSGNFSDYRVIAVSGTNDAPTLTDGNATIAETALPHSFNLLADANDVDNTKAQLHVASGTTVTLTAADGTTSTLSTDDYTLDTNAGTLTLKPGAYTDALHNNQTDTVTVHYEVTDGTSTTAAHDYVISVQGQPEQITGSGSFNGTMYDDNIIGSSAADTINGLAGNDTIYGLQGDDVLSGNQGDDVLNGGQGNDHLFGGQGADTLYGAAGDDILEGGAGDDTINGGSIINGAQVNAGVNTVSFQYAPAFVDEDGSASTLGVTIHLDTQTSNGQTITPFADGVTTGHDTLVDIQNAIGSAYDDSIYGDGGNNIQAGDGNDYIRETGGGNTLLGGNGDDYIELDGAGQNTVYGNVGRDEIFDYGAGDSYINGGQGDDYILDFGGTNTLLGGVGDDQIIAVDGNNTIYGNVGDDYVVVYGTGDNYVHGGQGNDYIQIEAGDNTLIGGVGTDTLSFADAARYTDVVTVSLAEQGGTAADGTVTAPSQQSVFTYEVYNPATGLYEEATSHDTISGFENLQGAYYANNDLTGDDNANTITGGLYDDRLQGNAGDDVLIGLDGNDTIYGNQGNDVLYGGRGNDTLVGGQGDDVLFGNTGVNTLTGGLGADKFMIAYHADDGSNLATNTSLTISDTITDFNHSQSDLIDLSAVAQAFGENLTYSGAAFSGAAGSLIVIQDPNGGIGNYVVEVDKDGNGTADFFLHVASVANADGTHTAPVASDFNLTTTPSYTAPAPDGGIKLEPNTAHVVDHHADIFG